MDIVAVLLLSHKKEQDNAICGIMDGPRDYTKWSKRLRKTNIIWYHLYVKSKKQTNKLQIQEPIGGHWRDRGGTWWNG